MTHKLSYREKLELKNSSLLAAGLVSERYPVVSSIVFQMTYYQKASDPVLMKRTVNFFPSHHACFHMECMREECADGGFDLAPVVAGLIKNRKKSAKGNITCNGNSDALGLGHASISYIVSIEYAKGGK